MFYTKITLKIFSLFIIITMRRHNDDDDDDDDIMKARK
jgi:hypothetical protein